MALIQLRRGTAAAWTSANPVLSSGEMGVETDTGFVKVGNGATAWNTLAYIAAGAAGTVTTNTASSVDSELSVFSGTTGKVFKRATGTGLAKMASGVLSAVAAPTGVVVGDTDAQSLSLKTLIAPKIANNDFIADGNGNELLVFGQTPNAVNEYRMINAATGVGPTLVAQGTNATVRANIDSKGGAGVWLDGDRAVSLLATQTLTNKRFIPRVSVITTSPAAPTINTDNFDVVVITGQTIDITSFTTNLSGTPGSEQPFRVAITGTAARAITWGASFENGPTTLPTTTVTTQRLDVGFFFNAASGKFRCFVANSA